MDTKVTIKTNNNLNNFECINEKQDKITLGNDGNSVGPMQAVLMAAAGCSSIDIVMILEKMKQPLKDIKVEVTGTRRDEVPKVYTKIHMHYILIGEIDEKKAEKAIELSLQKYCSVSLMLQKAAEITSSFKVVI